MKSGLDNKWGKQLLPPFPSLHTINGIHMKKGL